MTPLLAGHFSVDHSARLMRNYRYAVERAMRALGGWIALTPELSAKLLLGRHVWDLAQHADAFGKRLPELRAHAQVSEPASDRVVAFMDALEEPDRPPGPDGEAPRAGADGALYGTGGAGCRRPNTSVARPWQSDWP